MAGHERSRTSGSLGEAIRLQPLGASSARQRGAQGSPGTPPATENTSWVLPSAGRARRGIRGTLFGQSDPFSRDDAAAYDDNVQFDPYYDDFDDLDDADEGSYMGDSSIGDYYPSGDSPVARRRNRDPYSDAADLIPSKSKGGLLRGTRNRDNVAAISSITGSVLRRSASSIASGTQDDGTSPTSLLETGMHPPIPQASLAAAANDNNRGRDNPLGKSTIQWTRIFPFLRHFKPPRPSRQARTIPLFERTRVRYRPNIVRNQKYNVVTFIPLVLYEQFKFFFNLYFLLVALSQLIPALKIGYIITYFGPLVFVLAVSLSKEAWDDYKRWLRDNEANATLYKKWDRLKGDWVWVPSGRIAVGDAIIIEKNQRVPADCILLRTTEQSGSCFIRTDQLDGETDWKLRIALPITQKISNDQDLACLQGHITCEQPHKDIHSFAGNFTVEINKTDIDNNGVDILQGSNVNDDMDSQRPVEYTEPVNVDNMLWANTVVASGLATGIVVYTGIETRSAMNTSLPHTKVGLLDAEIDRLAKILAFVTLVLSFLMVSLNEFRGVWYVDMVRFLILFSTIIPISLRVNLDFAKTYYSMEVMSDADIRETVVRTSSIPEELGRIEYLLSDKTGTLTKNVMELRKIHMGTMSYSMDSMEQLKEVLAQAFASNIPEGTIKLQRTRDLTSRTREVLIALGVCHNVTPVMEDGASEVTYQASSPDEVAIVEWIAKVGLTLYYRDRVSIKLKPPSDGSMAEDENYIEFDILEVFPFTSETKRMGIVVQDRATGVITFYQKGADAIMANIVEKNDWLDEECGNMAREGLRTLVIGRRRLEPSEFQKFRDAYESAKRSLVDRNMAMQQVIEQHLEKNLELLGVTGVEDKLQDDVKASLELLRNAGLKIWMLTGDKIETATCIALSSKLVGRNQSIRQVSGLKSVMEASSELERLRLAGDCCLVIDGQSLRYCLDNLRQDFISIAVTLPAVVCCRVSPTQKADVTRLIKEYTGKRTCAIGDGGNDVSMIQAAHIGVGIVGKEGKQASLAADFSLLQFSYLTKLLLCHGRNSYKRSAKLVQFIIHRGLVISIMQALFSTMFYYAPVALYQGLLLVGYATAYTMAPVFSLVLDKDVREETALLYPELYKSLRKGRSLNMKTFFVWVLISVYQGGVLMLLPVKVSFDGQFSHLVSLSFTALLANELLVICMEINTWHRYMALSIVGSIIIYIGSMFVLREEFDLTYVLASRFWIETLGVVIVSVAPLFLAKWLKKQLSPPTYSKLEE